MSRSITQAQTELIRSELALFPLDGIAVVGMDCPELPDGEASDIHAAIESSLGSYDSLVAATHEYGPAAMYAMYPPIRKKLASMRVSGIVGNKAHRYGYHRCRKLIDADDYSRQAPRDQEGDPWAASAIDFALNEAQMKLVTARLFKAFRESDPRVHGVVREFFGTLDGRKVTGWNDYPSHSRRVGYTTSDPSHLWHIHLSIFRAFANDAYRMRLVVEVIIGVPLAKSEWKDDQEMDALDVWTVDALKPPAGHATDDNPKWTPGGFLRYIVEHLDAIERRIAALESPEPKSPNNGE